ncbi:aminopeptidase P N-terminal domain-containing protein [Kangiella sp. TOML190]|uniref:aminopeptidase P N-terminal domain-containing protein n=1 Tax=Kangiella sp. TOML190 TaxID=2931351 RepID=UPI00203C6708|nr:aminopeptidase P N-terminal domain-containing protein [Kangiella sp. TOML190]
MQAINFAARRKRLMQWMGPNSIAILPAASEKVRSRDVNYPYRQDSDFWYLTGFNEPEAVVVLIPNRKHGEFILFNREKDPMQETWHGKRLGQEGAMGYLAADDAFPITDIDDILPGLMEGKERIYFELGVNPEFDQQILEWRNQLSQPQNKSVARPGEMIDLKHHLHEMRLIKTQAEIQRMRFAANASAKAHKALMSACAAGKSEADMEAELLYHYAKNACRNAAYPSIVAAGDNANILHYIENDSALKDGELLLVDAGCEFEYYASDISRTIPISGQYTEPQAQLYDLVLKAQLAAIEMVKPGNHWNDIHDKAVEVITQGLIELKILKGSLKDNLAKETYKEFYMHKTGHWLGLDVHDVGDYQVHGQSRLLEAGMVLTVEPGIYISKSNRKVAKKWRGIGIRIEDDVVVTKKGYDILSKAVPKCRDEIERWMQQTA